MSISLDMAEQGCIVELMLDTSILKTNGGSGLFLYVSNILEAVNPFIYYERYALPCHPHF